ncbi:RNA polymerase sigma-70 factor [Dactylosporangium sp. NPDC049742]|uniref:RNA polymerase sigma-70 factor n=1 Tax=Dactylosporangium sp. NPDC049742 TaxID=3154737 RepID=UPI00342799BD
MMTDEFEIHRRLVFSVAYRILGSASDAEDAVQDAWLKWSSVDRSQVADAKPYIVRIVTNVAMDRLRSARSRREVYVGPWLPEPIPTEPGTDSGESLSMALLVVLETLSPLERAVFVLKEAFGFTYAEIAAAVERSEDAVRQVGHRAREHVHARRPRFHAGQAAQRQVTERFFAAATGGDINTLMQLLAPDVTLWTDGGGKVRQATRPVTGAERVAAWFATLGQQPYQGVQLADMRVDLVEFNGGPGIVFRGAGRVIGTMTLDLDDQGRIAGIYNVANPDKLQAL